MPYDPRPVSEGGNRNLDDTLSRKAPPGQFRVIGVDTFDGGDCKIGDYSDLLQARIALQKEIEEATKNSFGGSIMFKGHIYDDQGRHILDRGEF